MLDEQKVKNLLSREVLSQMKPTERDIIREILFADDTNINWDNVYDLIVKHMPEVKLNADYSENDMKSNEQSYLTKTIKIKAYNPKYGDDKKCKCGHSYYRHFDCCEGMAACGCKYCECDNFVFEGVD